MVASMAPRPAAPSRKTTNMRPPVRPGAIRAQTATPTLQHRSSAEDTMLQLKQRTPKRKAQAEQPESEVGEETNINVVVRCRGRNDREVRENSGVVVSTDGIKSKRVELSMGPNALSNKSYQFDKVFSPAADQGMIFNEVVVPILDEVLAGFNCTIFAYGQTGTGKTYTMSGDISNTLPTPDAAGIIPRILHTLFARLGQDDTEVAENTVKCSFIELYNEELRDLLAPDDSTKLKIYDEANKSGRTTTLVQGMEESYIRSAAKGIQLLRNGSHKRQVAATKCNDLSSRSHTVFTITVYVRRPSDTGDEFVSAGKLNLVDLAGSENIERSGAENKRAAEAGLINKSLLTLGRVINALVEKSRHIPYRESKLTRLLQDSLGGRTKTCIIATLSPAKSNLEETISTLDYAFRAKNIRNKPQLNQLVSKKTLLREFTTEIEKLKSELIATRHRNGVYLTAETYEEITTESESRRILSEEQRDKIETMEANLRNKVQQLFALTGSFQTMKKDHEQIRTTLDGTKNVLDRTEIVLAHTKRNLAEETHLRKEYQATEGRLAVVGDELLSTLGTTTDHIGRLHSKLRRRSELHSENRNLWTDSQFQITEKVTEVEDRLEVLRGQQTNMLSTMSARMQEFVAEELRELHVSQKLLNEKTSSFLLSESEINAQTSKARDGMNEVLEEIWNLREEVKQNVGAGLSGLSSAAQRISVGIATELDAFHGQLESSYVSLGREFRTIFEDITKRMHEQQTEAQRLREQILAANTSFVEANSVVQAQVQQALLEERQTAATERAELVAKISGLISDSAMTQERRTAHYFDTANKRIKTSESSYRVSQQVYDQGMDVWNNNAKLLSESSIRSRDLVKSKLQADWSTANEYTSRILHTTKAVHGETVEIVDRQMTQMDRQLSCLDQIVERVKEQNEEHHLTHNTSLAALVTNIQGSYQGIGRHFDSSFDRVTRLDQSMQGHTANLQGTLPSLEEHGDIRTKLHQLRQDLSDTPIQEYAITGETPAKIQYSYPDNLPRTASHAAILDRIRGGTSRIEDASSPAKSPCKPSPLKRGVSPSKIPISPSKTQIFMDVPLVPETTQTSSPTPSHLQSASSAQPTQTLRELDVNITSIGIAIPARAEGGGIDAGTEAKHGKMSGPPLKRHHTNPILTSQVESKASMKKRMTVVGLAEGGENLVPGMAGSNLSASLGPGNGRRLRNRAGD